MDRKIIGEHDVFQVAAAMVRSKRITPFDDYNAIRIAFDECYGILNDVPTKPEYVKLLCYTFDMVRRFWIMELGEAKGRVDTWTPHYHNTHRCRGCVFESPDYRSSPLYWDTLDDVDKEFLIKYGPNNDGALAALALAEGGSGERFSLSNVWDSRPPVSQIPPHLRGFRYSN